MHGTDAQLSVWELSHLTNPAWAKYHMDHPAVNDNTDYCFPPLILLTLPGVTMIPLNPKQGKGFSGAKQPPSSVTVAYDDHFRIIIHSTESVQLKLREELNIPLDYSPPPPRDAVAAYPMDAGGRATAGGAMQERVYTRHLPTSSSSGICRRCRCCARSRVCVCVRCD